MVGLETTTRLSIKWQSKLKLALVDPLTFLFVNLNNNFLRCNKLEHKLRSLTNQTQMRHLRHKTHFWVVPSTLNKEWRKFKLDTLSIANPHQKYRLRKLNRPPWVLKKGSLLVKVRQKATAPKTLENQFKRCKVTASKYSNNTWTPMETKILTSFTGNPLRSQVLLESILITPSRLRKTLQALRGALTDLVEPIGC